MPARKILCLIAVGLMLTGCQSLNRQSVTQTALPRLDASLSKPCDTISEPDGEDVDSVLDWSLDLLNKYSECSLRHDAVVKAYNNAQQTESK